MELTCVICNGTFEQKPRGPAPETCPSPDCRRARRAQSVRESRWRQRGGSTTQTRKCSACGQDFIYVRTAGMHGRGPGMCSEECRAASARESRRLATENFRDRHREFFDSEEYKAGRRAYNLKTKYGLDEAGYDRLLAGQGGGCAICRSSDPGHWTGKFMVDHSHVTGAVRGLLCSPCNRAIGLLGDNPDTLTAAAAYVRASRAEGVP